MRRRPASAFEAELRRDRRHVAAVVIVCVGVLVALVLGWLRHRTGSLVPGMIAHGIWNGSVIALAYA